MFSLKFTEVKHLLSGTILVGPCKDSRYSKYSIFIIDWSTYMFTICIYRISLKLLSIKMKVCESSVQRILYHKIFSSDPLYQKCQYCCEINGFFWWSHGFYRLFLVTLWKISKSNVNLYTFPDFIYVSTKFMRQFSFRQFGYSNAPF